MKKRIFFALVLLLGVIALAKVCLPDTSSSENKKPRQSQTNHKKTTSLAENARPYRDPKDLRKEGTWKLKSEKKKYPKIKSKKGLLIRVSLMGNRVYIIKNGKVVYTMLSTAGIFHGQKSDTPTGTFYVRNDRDNQFFNYKLNEGAKNWTSWDEKNVYLFHSVPTKANGKFNLKEAQKLGKTQGSHGCVRLSLPDSKWFMENIPAGTKVVIKNE